ncbi:MAG: hypothetical protein RLZZ78_1439, partial [Armatimonadota bacterium]
HATLAQLVEQRTENPRVTGSSPVGGTIRRPSFLARVLIVLEPMDFFHGL